MHMTSVEALYLIDEHRSVSAFLSGILLPLQPSDRTVLKEKSVWLSPTMGAICWRSRSSNAQVRSVPLQSIIVAFLVECDRRK